MQELQTILDLINALKVIPGIGNKSSERIAYEFLKMDQTKIDNLINSLKNIKTNLSICPTCGSYMENDKCLICNDETRDKSTLIVVSSFKDVLSLERLNSLHASYHILNGTISPTKGISASDINIEKLLKRIGKMYHVELTNKKTIGDDFSLYNLISTTNYSLLGVKSAFLHQSDFDFNDDVLLVGLNYFISLLNIK